MSEKTLKQFGTTVDGREIYVDEKGMLWARNRIPYTTIGPTPTEIEQFEKEHPDAEPYPVCGFKFYVSIFGISIAYEIVGREGFCSVCHGDPDFPHKVQSSTLCHSPNQSTMEESQ